MRQRRMARGKLRRWSRRCVKKQNLRQQPISAERCREIASVPVGRQAECLLRLVEPYVSICLAFPLCPIRCDSLCFCLACAMAAFVILDVVLYKCLLVFRHVRLLMLWTPLCLCLCHCLCCFYICISIFLSPSDWHSPSLCVGGLPVALHLLLLHVFLHIVNTMVIKLFFTSRGREREIN